MGQVRVDKIGTSIKLSLLNHKEVMLWSSYIYCLLMKANLYITKKGACLTQYNLKIHCFATWWRMTIETIRTILGKNQFGPMRAQNWTQHTEKPYTLEKVTVLNLILVVWAFLHWCCVAWQGMQYMCCVRNQARSDITPCNIGKLSQKHLGLWGVCFELNFDCCVFRNIKKNWCGNTMT